MAAKSKCGVDQDCSISTDCWRQQIQAALPQNWNVRECSHYKTTNSDAASSPWSLESLAPGKVRQDRANDQRPKATSAVMFWFLRSTVTFMAEPRLHRGLQSLVLGRLSTGSRRRRPKLQFGYQHQQLQVRDPGLPTHAVVPE